jgi:hypothetical protein
MTAAAETTVESTIDWRTVVGGGAILGAITAIGVAIFAFLSRGMAGGVERIVQSILVLAGGVVFAFFPATRHQPTDVDGISWNAMIGLMGALFFTVVDVVVFRPINLYHWTWDAIGGGSGFWYIPVWWMGSAVLAWLGSWVVANSSRGGTASIPKVAIQSVAVAIVMAAILMVTGVVPFTAAGVALAFCIGLVLHVPLAARLP